MTYLQRIRSNVPILVEAGAIKIACGCVFLKRKMLRDKRKFLPSSPFILSVLKQKISSLSISLLSSQIQKPIGEFPVKDTKPEIQRLTAQSPSPCMFPK